GPVPAERGRRHLGGAGLVRDVEGAALAGEAGELHPEGAAHELGEPSADGEPEAGTAIAPAGRDVRLAEGLEEPVSAIGGDPDARVPHGEVIADRAGPLGRAGAGRDDDLTGLGELDGVVEQIEQDLAE